LTSEDLIDVVVKNVPNRLLEDFDDAIKTKYPGGRSEAIRDLMRLFVRQEKREET
jgi:metal-responsive CopG/Arc/MetJ family transcriptional regulator